MFSRFNFIFSKNFIWEMIVSKLIKSIFDIFLIFCIFLFISNKKFFKSSYSTLYTLRFLGLFSSWKYKIN